MNQTGEAGQNVWTLGEVKIAEDAEMDGYYCIITSECGWSVREVIDAYRDLSRIEKSFRVLKSTMDVRPVFVWMEEHIRAHFLVCYVAFMIMRFMQKDVEDASGTRPSADAIHIRRAFQHGGPQAREERLVLRLQDGPYRQAV